MFELFKARWNTRRNTRWNKVVVVGLPSMAVVLIALWLVGLLGARTDVSDPIAPPFAFDTIVPLRSEAPVPARTVIAEVTGPVPVFDAPDGAEVGALPTGSWWTDTKYLPVTEQRAGWLQVRLPERPNGSTGWIRSADAALSDTRYGILIDTDDRRIQLFEDGTMVVDAPAGVGTEDDPTPLGQFYVMDVAAPPGPGWGPFVLDTNAHSETIESWQGSGDAFTSIHGPLGAEGLIGTEGAAISHGCIRLHEADLAKFSPVPPGAPVVII